MQQSKILLITVLFMCVHPMEGTFWDDVSAFCQKPGVAHSIRTAGAIAAAGAIVGVMGYRLYRERDARALIEAAGLGDMDAVNKIIVRHRSDCTGRVVNADRYGWTALMMAANAGHVDVVNALLANGVGIDVNKASNAGWTALMCATYQGHVDVVNAIVQHCEATGRILNINTVTRAGRTALICAGSHITSAQPDRLVGLRLFKEAIFGRRRTRSLLVARGDAAAEAEEAPEIVLNARHAELVRLLIAARAEPNPYCDLSDDGISLRETALHRAVKANAEHLVALIVAACPEDVGRGGTLSPVNATLVGR